MAIESVNSTSATRVGIYYGWMQVLVASLAMSATLPGRTHGLGLITTPLTQETGLGISEQIFSQMNLIATLLGAAFSAPVGWAIDRFGARRVLAAVVLLLAVSVAGMSTATAHTMLPWLTAVRGFGQAALSVVAIALVSKWFQRRLGPAMGLFTILLAFGFIVGTISVGSMVQQLGWRQAWLGVAAGLAFGFLPLALWLTRDTPESMGLQIDGDAAAAADAITNVAADLAAVTHTAAGSAAVENANPAISHQNQPGLSGPSDATLVQALLTRDFWLFTASASVFNALFSAVTLFQQSLLIDKGFGNETFLLVMSMIVFGGLPANLLAGWLSTDRRNGRILAVGMGLMGAAMAIFPFATSSNLIVAYAAALGTAGGIVTVVFFSAYGHRFGRKHLGAIQAAVQLLMVCSSATGPLLLTSLKEATGSSGTFFLLAATLSAISAITAVFIRGGSSIATGDSTGR